MTNKDIFLKSNIYAQIYQFTKDGIESVYYQETEHYQHLFTWDDEHEKYMGTTNKLDTVCLFKKLILSDIAEDTELDGAVYIIDNQRGNVFFLYDDRGIDVYSDNEDYILSLKNLE